MNTDGVTAIVARSTERHYYGTAVTAVFFPRYSGILKRNLMYPLVNVTRIQFEIVNELFHDNSPDSQIIYI